MTNVCARNPLVPFGFGRHDNIFRVVPSMRSYGYADVGTP